MKTRVDGKNISEMIDLINSNAPFERFYNYSRRKDLIYELQDKSAKIDEESKAYFLLPEIVGSISSLFVEPEILSRLFKFKNISHFNAINDILKRVVDIVTYRGRNW